MTLELVMLDAVLLAEAKDHAGRPTWSGACSSPTFPPRRWCGGWRPRTSSTAPTSWMTTRRCCSSAMPGTRSPPSSRRPPDRQPGVR